MSSNAYDSKPWLAAYAEGVPAEIDPPTHTLPQVMEESVRRYGSRSALWWRGTPPRQWPEAAATYRDFAAAHRGLAGTDPA